MTGFWLPLLAGLVLIIGPLLWWATSRVHRPAPLGWCQGCDQLVDNLTWEMDGWYRCPKCHGHGKKEDDSAAWVKMVRESEAFYRQIEKDAGRCYETYIWQGRQPIHRSYPEGAIVRTDDSDYCLMNGTWQAYPSGFFEVPKGAGPHGIPSAEDRRLALWE